MKTAFSLLALIYLGFGLLMFIIQRNLLFIPSPAFEHSYPTLFLQNEASKTEIIVVNAGKEKALFYFGGNAESVIFSAEELASEFKDYSVYLSSYRGYGNSSGSPSEMGLFEDALSLYDAVSANHSSISLIGRSLGSGVASFLASQREVENLVLITPFDSIRAVAQKRFPV